MEELIPIRYGRMAAGPFAVYRGAAAIMAGDAPRIIDQPPLIFHHGDTRGEAFRATWQRAISSHHASLSPEGRVRLSRYTLVDVAVNVVGVGSVGTFCGIALFLSGNGDPLFFQCKQAQRSVLDAIRSGRVEARTKD